MIIDGAHKSCRASDTWKRMIAWHYVGICRACRATGVGPTSNQRLAIKLARWAKLQRANVIDRRRANNTADKMPALVQQTTAIWALNLWDLGGKKNTLTACSLPFWWLLKPIWHPWSLRAFSCSVYKIKISLLQKTTL